jgi:YesN/AraC family two-component response regulator
MARVLVADGDKELREAAARKLAAGGLAVHTCASGREALQQLCSEQFEAAIVDTCLGDLGGLEVVKAIRARGIRTAVIVTAFRGTTDQAVLAMKSGAQDFLQKPIGTSHLANALHKLIDGRCLPRKCLAHRLDAYVLHNAGRVSLNLTELCEQFRISPGYACRLFRSHLDATFRERLTRHRVRQAKLLLETTDKPLYTIAEECGFRSPSRLTEVFRASEGVPPRVFREVCGSLMIGGQDG